MPHMCPPLFLLQNTVYASWQHWWGHNLEKSPSLPPDEVGPGARVYDRREAGRHPGGQGGDLPGERHARGHPTAAAQGGLQPPDGQGEGEGRGRLQVHQLTTFLPDPPVGGQRGAEAGLQVPVQAGRRLLRGAAQGPGGAQGGRTRSRDRHRETQYSCNVETPSVSTLVIV